MPIRDRVGDVIDRLTVIKRGPDHLQPNGRKRIKWQCICVCGTTVFVEASNLKQSHTTSCGCLVKENCSTVGKQNLKHGMTNSREWLAWRGAKDRCFNPFTEKYMNCGARKITMTPRWENSFEEFFLDMGVCPVNYSLERVDVNGDYEPANCIWATAKQQCRNKQNTVRVIWDNKKVPLVELAEKYGLPRNIVYDRVTKQNWSVHNALTTPVRKRNAKTI